MWLTQGSGTRIARRGGTKTISFRECSVRGYGGDTNCSGLQTSRFAGYGQRELRIPPGGKLERQLPKLAVAYGALFHACCSNEFPDGTGTSNASRTQTITSAYRRHF